MTTIPPMPNPENTPVVHDNAESLDAAKKIENTKRQQHPANEQAEDTHLSQDFEAQVKRGVKPIGIDE